jgi:hypothetical protein
MASAVRSRRKRTLLAIGLLVVLAVVLAIGMPWMTAPAHRITLRNIEKIQGGMTEPQAEAILGAPAGDYSDGRNQPAGGVSSFPGGLNKKWIAEDCAVELAFAPNGRVGGISMTDARPESWLARLRRWLGL